MHWFIDIICIAITIFAVVKLNKKQVIDKTEYEKYQEELAHARANLSTISYNCEQICQRTRDAEAKYYSIIEQYKEATSKNQQDLDLFFKNQREFRQSELDTEFENKTREREEKLDLEYKIKQDKLNDKLEQYQQSTEENIAILKKNEEAILSEVKLQQQKYEGLLAPLKQYEMEQQQRLFYTIQVPDEYKQDIDYLLTVVAQKVQHPDIINKLIWAEYVKPYIDETFKRVGIEDQSGIYKLTNINDGKAYIGKSTNIKKRIADHFKSAIGIKTIADQAVHHAMLDSGFWNWTIEYIIYCDKDELNEMEKYYIDFFKTQEFGYNKTAGG